ncbi:MAG TPA: response regulator [Polaromonas sp.]|uniref:response regulator n=1 Tax=Polaromonas sp. TaxID=1869339 RepID=UPI002D310EDC|nr:response regulator [Polaromonas sp.]HYW56614.1 response regulator [Polaromonas sp.]
MKRPAPTVLIVDDEPQNCRLLEALLHNEGYHTISADSGADAIRLVAIQAPDLILLDVMMPSMDGYQVAAQLKADPASSSIPIIMLTALEDRQARLQSLKAGVEEFLSKPVDQSELRLRARNLLRLKEYSDFLRDHNLLLEEQVMARTAELRKSTELQLSEAARQGAILNALPAHIALLDRKGIIISVNGAWQQFADANVLVSPSHGPGTDYLRVCDEAQSDEDARHAAQGIRAVLRGTLPSFSLEYACHLPLERRWFMLSVTPLSSDRAGGVIVMHLDVSERKQAQEDLQLLNDGLEERVRRRTDQLQVANEELEAFSYSASHDLRTPLSAIDGYSSLLAKDIGAGGSERGKHYLSRIRAGVVQMGELIDALLSLAQLSRSKLTWETVDLSAMATAVLDDYCEREPQRSVAITVAPGMRAEGDSRLLQQVLDNLLGNAWKFTNQTAQARINVSCSQGSAGEAIYTIQDNGAGFDMAYSDKLFGAFQRLHTNAEFAGTGIGLATVHRIISHHGGRIWAESAPDAGSSFHFTLGKPKD